MGAGLVAGMVAGVGEVRPAVDRSRTHGLGRHELNDLARVLVEVAHEEVDAVEQVVVSRDRDHGDRQTHCSRHERQADAVGERFPLRGADAAAEGVERLDHPDDRAEQAEQWGERRGAVEHAYLLPLLDVPDGQEQLARLIQESWFGQLPGGVLWRVDQPESEDDPAAQTKTPLTPGVIDLLDALNAGQIRLDAAGRLLATLQWEIYALWWKQQYLAATASTPIPNAAQVVEAAFTAKTTAATQLIAEWKVALQAVTDATANLRAQLGDLDLRSVPEPVFWRPNDPLLMIQGVGRSYAHGEDGRYSFDGNLFCRFSGQAISGLTVAATTSPVTATGLGLRLLVADSTPPDLNDLLVEAYLLDPSNAGAIAVAADPANPPQAATVAAQQTLMWNSLSGVPLDQQTLAEAAGLQSEFGPVTVPSKIAVNYWSPPWAPLYLDWSVDYYPTGSAQTGWTFPANQPNDPLAEQTAQWTGSVPQAQFPLQGRSLLTPQATDALAARLTQLVAHFGDTPELKPYLDDVNEAIAYLEDACVLAQSLSGWTDLLLARSPAMRLPPDLSALGQWLAPDGAPSYTPTAAPVPNSMLPFSAISGGFMALQTVWVIDAFGQRYDALATLQANPSALGLQSGPDFRPSVGSALLQVKPRLPQPSRLRLTFLDGNDDGLLVGSSFAADPICGWLLANRLDDALVVYDHFGVMQGELILERNTALWLPAPDLAGPQEQVGTPALANLHLATLINGIVESTNSGGALKDLITTIQQASWAIAPTGPDAQQLAALVGFPIAVARAQILLETFGAPATSQGWEATGRDLDGGLAQASFTVRLGSTDMYDDALIGALADDDPAHLISPYGPGSNGYVVAGQHQVTANSALTLTLLLHPHGTVHAFTGLLPSTVAALPPACQEAPLRSMEVTFRSGPLLSPATGLSAPLPAAGRGDWSWLEFPSTSAPAVPRPVTAADSSARTAGRCTGVARGVAPDDVHRAADDIDVHADSRIGHRWRRCVIDFGNARTHRLQRHGLHR